MKKQGLPLLILTVFLVSLTMVFVVNIINTNTPKNLNKQSPLSKSPFSKTVSPFTPTSPNKKDTDYTIALLSDSHLNYQLLRKALTRINMFNVSYVIHLGDLSDYGGISNLKKSREILEESNIKYLVLPGDRDVISNGMETRLSDSPFSKIFANRLCNNQLLRGYKIICLSNPYNYQKLKGSDLKEFLNKLPQAEVVIGSQPIFNIQGTRYMGFYNKEVLKQAQFLRASVEKSKIKYYIAADTHFGTKYRNNNIEYYTIGAVTPNRNIQKPNFSILTHYTDGTYSLNQYEIE